MYKCKYCNQEFDTPQKIGGHVLQFHKKENNGSIRRKQKREEEYNKSPVLCKQCGSPIPYDKIRREKDSKFCCSSCAATFNNKNRIKKTKCCLYCGQEIKQKFGPFCCSEHSVLYKKKEAVQRWLNGEKLSDVRIRTSKSIREYLLKEQNNKCAICGQTNIWNNKPVVFIMDHIDGNADNNAKENIRLICPMCDSQTETYKGLPFPL